MISYFVSFHRSPLDDDDTYFRKRMRYVASIVRFSGAWGTEHAQRIVAWSEHLKRPRNHQSLAARLYLWRNEAWLQQRRLDPHTGGTTRPGTRVFSGPVHRRWDESVDVAAADARL